MSTKIIVTGNLGQEPELKYSASGTPVLSLSIAGTHSQRDKTTGDWSDVGEPLWIRAPFFRDEAEHLARVLSKGDRVTVEGVLKRDVWNTSNGEQRESLEVHFPRFLGVVPRRDRQPQSSTPAQSAYAQPADNPWEQATAVDGAPSYSQADAPF